MVRREWASSATLRVIRRPGERLHAWLRGSPSGLVALALTVGVGAGVGAVVFRYLILWVTMLLTGHADYSVADHAANPLVSRLGMWFVVLAPVVGGLAYGPLVEFFAREARGHGVPEVMFAVAEQGGRIRPQVAVVKSIASAVCIGSGGSVGREGPIVQIGSALGSALGQALRVSESRLRLLVACGAAGGISATFNAPIAGVMFALELILRDFEAHSFGVVVLASVAANVIGRAAFGSGAFLALPAFKLTSLWEYLLYTGLGLLASVTGVAFIRILYGVEDLVDGLWRGPEWLRPAVGGVALGGLLLALPEMYGVGYPVLERAIGDGYGSAFLTVLLIGKILATSVTIGIGGSGGVFAPSLFIGSMLGTAYGHLLHGVLPGLAGPAGAYGLVGMGAVFAAAARAPITAVLIIFELTGDYQIILPLMFAIALAARIGSFLSQDTIYTLKLRRRGVDITRHARSGLMAALRVGDAMEPIPEGVPQEIPLDQVIARFAREERTVGELARETPAITEDQNLEQALTVLVHSEDSGVPVLSTDRRTVVGWLTHQGVLRAYHERMKSAGS